MEIQSLASSFSPNAKAHLLENLFSDINSRKHMTHLLIWSEEMFSMVHLICHFCG